MKTCSICGRVKPLSSFDRNKRKADGFDVVCKECKHTRYLERRKSNYFKQYCITKRSECKAKGIAYNLTPEYLQEIWTGICPIFGIELHKASHGKGSVNSAHLDRLDPNKGYVVGNVSWISGRANRIKYNATIEELRKIADWMERATTSRKA